MRRAARVDANQGEIVDGLRRFGASVTCLHRVGHGVPDLLAGWQGKNYLIECKIPGAKLTGDEPQWHAEWRGQVDIAESLEDALAIITNGAVEAW